MPYSGAGKNAALTAILADAAWIGLYERVLPEKLLSSGGLTEKIKSTAHGLANGQLIVFTKLTGGTGLATLLLGRPYYVVQTEANFFKVSQVPGGAPEIWTNQVTAGNVAALTEVDTARVATAFGTVAKGTVEDTTAHVLKVPALKAVNYIGYFSASSEGTLGALKEVPEAYFPAEGPYTVTKTVLDYLGVA